MHIPERFGPAQGVVILLVAGLVFFLIGFWLARSTVATATTRDQTRWQFVSVGDTVAAIDVQTGEAYAIDGNTRAWTVLAPALPSRGEVKTSK
ncbi:MAG TPA: hypothetical protein VFD58_32285 [Blastocatellia bacterium]|nr:hypothetical protein [Blastocatellia bacterium]